MRQAETLIQSQEKISVKDWLLIVSTVLAPMTGWRIWKIGPAEAMCFVWCLLHYRSLRYIDTHNRFVRFWFFFLITATLGSFYGALFYPEELYTTGVLTWVYFALISLTVIFELGKRSAAYLIQMISIIFVLSAMWYMFLFLYSRIVSPTFFGAPLWYSNVRFSGGGLNPHQLSMPLSVFAIGCLWLFLQGKGMWKLFYLACVASTLFLIAQTKASTAYAATACGMLILLWKPFSRLFLQTRVRQSLFILILLVVLVLLGDRLFSRLMAGIASDPNGMGRFTIFASYPISFWKSPLIGLGPGVHGLNGAIEYHNTILEVLAMGGIAGGVVFFSFTFHLGKISLRSPLLMATVITLYVFGLAGFAMRRLVYWILLGLTYLIATKEDGTIAGD